MKKLSTKLFSKGWGILTMIVLTIVLPLSQVTAQCTCTGNLVQNPSFESGTTSWSWSGGNFSAGTGAVKCGSYSGDFEITNTSNNWVSQTIGTDLPIGTVINASVWAGTHDNSFYHAVIIDFFDANWNWISNSAVHVDKVLGNAPVGPQLYTWSATVPANCKYTNVGFSGNGSWLKTDQWCVTTSAPTTVALGNEVFVDLNGNGVKDGSEWGLDGVTVKLYLDANQDNNPDGAALATQTTANGGKYNFSNLAPGNYMVQIENAPGWLFNVPRNGGDPDNNIDNDNNGLSQSGTTIKGGTITLSVGGEPGSSSYNGTYDFAIYKNNGLGDYVFLDANANGIQDAGDQPLANVTVRLKNTAGTVLATTTSDATGYYFFYDPAQYGTNTYNIEFVTPAGYSPSPSNQGSDDTKDSDPVSGVISNVTVPNGTWNYTFDAGFVSNNCNCPGTNVVLNPSFENGTTSWSWSGGTLSAGGGAVACGSASGDLNNTSASSIAWQNIGTNLAVGTTINASVYAGTHDNTFNNFVAIQFLDGAGTVLGSSVYTQVDKILANAPVGPQLYTISATVPSGAVTTRVAFGGNGSWTKTDYWCVNVTAPVCTGRVTGIYFNKLDGGADLPITNGAVFTTAQLGSLYNLEASTTGTIGSILYTITGPTPSSNIENTAPYNSPGTGSGAWTGAAGTYNVNLKTYNASGATGALCHDTTISFILDPATGSIGDRVWFDANGNGIQDASETTGITGVTVQLRNASGTVIATTTTNASGNYLFSGLAAGNYTVVFPATISGAVVTTQNVGGNDDVDSDASQATGITPTIVLGAGQNITNVDAGYCPTTLVIGNFVWFDRNNNGTQDAGEPGVAGATVRLYADNNNDNVPDGAAIATVTTNASGNYTFANLAPGNYIVGVVLPSGYAAANTTATSAAPNNDDNTDNNGVTTVSGEVRSNNITLVAGTEPTTDGDGNDGNLTLDFGLKGTGSIGDFVFVDANGNGIQDGGEAGIPNVTVTLTYPDGATVSTTTDANGVYSFINLPPTGAGQSYSVAFTTPAGYTPTTSNVGSNDAVDSDPIGGVVSGITLTAGQSNTTIDAGFYQLLSLGDRVFEDRNDNGFRDANELGVSGVTVNLYLDANNDNVPDGASIATATTNATGNYRFDNLAPNNYIVGIVLPTGYRTSTLTGVDPDNNTDVDDNGNNTLVAGEIRGNAITLSVGAETLENGNYNHTYDFGIISMANLGDKVWRDDNQNGVQDAGEPGVAGITVSLFDNTGKLVGNTVTDAYGNYLFSNLLAGDYTVSVTLPANYTFTSSTGTSETNATNSDVNATTGTTTTITLSPGENQLNIDAGIIFNNPPAKANIGDRVWFDTDGDGVQEAGEPGVAGVTVTLYDNTGAAVATAVTDANGNYLFTDVTPGTGYTIGFTAPVGTVFSPKDATADGNDSDADPVTGRTPAFTVVAGTTDLSFDAGIKPQAAAKASLGDKVFNDIDRDGIQDAGEPGIAGVTVNLYAANGTTLLATTTTDAFGNYTFNNLDAGTYVVGFVKPSGYTSSPKDAGADDAKDSDADVTTGRTGQIVLAAGDKNTTVDAGMYITTPPGSLQLGDKVFNDENRDGVQVATEDGVAGITVILYQNGVDGLPGTADDVKLKTTSTDKNGNYLFTDLAPSTGASSNYNVQFSNLPSGYSFTTQDQTAGGGNDANDSDPNRVTGRTGSINLTATNLTVDAGIVQGVAAGKGSLGDRVWYDMPGGTTGVQDATEQGVAGVIVNLYRDANNDGTISGAELTAVATTTTNALGNYLFGGLDAGAYQVGFSNLPANFTLTTKDAGADDAKDSDGNPLGASANGNTAAAGTSYTNLISLAQGEDNLTVDLGIVPPANTNSLGGDVWKDSNNDGVQTAGEQPVKGVMVTLYNSNGDPIATTVTDENGRYLFVGLPDGAYSVGFSSLPAGYNFTNQSATNDATGSDANVTTGRTAQVTLGPGNRNDTSLDAGLVTTRAALGNYVWFDANGNGIQEATESPISGVTVTLTRPGFGLDGVAGNADDALPVATSITDATGGYFFGNLVPGNYVVNFATIPANTMFTQQNTPGDNQNNTNSDANPATGNSASIALSAGETDLTIDAGVKPNLPGAVGDFVWNDLDSDGIQDANEPGIPGVVATLYNSANQPVGSAITDGNGAYLITNVPAGTGYYVIFSNLPTGAVFTTQDQTAGGGNDTNDSDANPATGATGSITVVAGETNTTVDAGIKTSILNLGNYVWYDRNNNGTQDANEPGIVGATVRLYADNNGDNLPDGAAIATTTTATGGIYNFTNLLPGNYIVGVVIPNGYAPAATTATSATPNNNNNTDNNGTIIDVATNELRNSNSITLAANTEPDTPVDGDGTNGNLTLDFGLRGTASLGNFVWEDRNRNGLQDANEPGIVGATVTLTYPGGATASTTTGAGGIYGFANLAPGTYSVTFTTPAGNFASTTSNVGANDAIDSDPVNGVVSGIVINAGDANNTIDAGFYKLMNIYGNVWHDANALIDNQVNRTSNIAIPVGLNIYLVDDATGLIVRAEGIEPDGSYSFLDVQGYKSYRIVLSSVVRNPGQQAPPNTLPSGWRNTGENEGAGIGSGSDGIADGVLFIDAEGVDINNANFGIRIKNGEVIIG
jgi:protocatechuate 3,4-dioxygenase beta subunit